MLMGVDMRTNALDLGFAISASDKSSGGTLPERGSNSIIDSSQIKEC